MCRENQGYSIYITKAGKSKKDRGRKTPIYLVRVDNAQGMGQLIGKIKFRGAWRQFVFHPEPGTYWNDSCLHTVITFLRALNREWREKHRRGR